MAAEELAGPAKLLETTLNARSVMRYFIGTVLALYREKIGFGKCEFHYTSDIFSSFRRTVCLWVELLVNAKVVVKVPFGHLIHPVLLRNLLLLAPLAGA